MAQPTQQVPPRAFSPAQAQPSHAHSPSPVAQQPGYALPANPSTAAAPRPPTRPPSFQVQPAHSQPASPYSAPSPFQPASPSVATPTSAQSPSFPTIQPAPPPPQAPSFAPQSYASTNGTTASTNNYARPPHIPLTTATTSSMPTPVTPVPAPGTPGLAIPQPYANATFAPTSTAPNTPGAMAPPPGRPQREYEYDVTDSLLGTGVNIREEENALADYYAGSFGQDARTGFPANAPGNRSSFYGAGFANQPGLPVDVSQKEFEAAEAERAWTESAARLSQSRAVEHNDPFLNYANLHSTMAKVAESYGLELNLDNKNTSQPQLQKSRNPAEYPAPKVTTHTMTGPDGTIVSVNGTVLPTDSYLIDQIALLSIAGRQRIRGILQECDEMATHRQQSSHGVIPMAWSDDGIPLEAVGLYDSADPKSTDGGDGKAGGNGSANGGGQSNPRKRGLQPLHPHSQWLLKYAREERAAEEERLQKRQKRLEEETAQNGSRAGSVAPGTPGSVAPEPEKAPTKKEQKKASAQKHDASAESVNTTMNKFLGGGKKKYAWMMGGASGGARAQSRASGTAPGTPTSTTAPKAPEKTSLTQEGRSKLGTWKEHEKAKQIEMRDVCQVLKRDGREPMELQKAYFKL